MKKVSALSSFWLMLLSRDGCDRDSGLVFLELWQNTLTEAVRAYADNLESLTFSGGNFAKLRQIK
jgi:hypothetical protein